jgi:hypothetical protein
MSSKQIDPETIPMEELKALIETEAAQPRDEQGRFVSPAAIEVLPVQEPEPPAAPEPQTFRETIDLGDGSGLQVFESDSEAGLRGQLKQALWHANKKIREDNQKAKAAEAVKTQITADDRYVLAQRLTTEPDAVINDLTAPLRQEIEALRAEREAEKAQRKANEDAVAWTQANPDYYVCPQNAKLMGMYMGRHEGDLDAAYAEALADEVLRAKPAEIPTTRAEAIAAIAPRPRSSGLSARASALAPEVDENFPFGDPNKMTKEQIEAADIRMRREGRY